MEVLTYLRGPKDESSIAMKLRKHLTSTNPALKHYAEDFLYALCDQDGISRFFSRLTLLASEFVKLVGMGHAAGFLMERKLWGALGGGAKATEWKETHTDVKEEEEVEDEEVNEEEEREAAELMAKIQRLQELGVIQMVNKP
jgi:hypothetical protein